MSAEMSDGGRKKPGRRAETPQQRLERLERELVAAKRAAAEAYQRQLATIGGAVLAEADSNPAFRVQLQAILRARVTSKAGKEAIASLLATATVEEAAA